MPANLANLSTRAKLAVFGECEYSPKRPFSEMCETCQTCRHSPSRVARTRQTRIHSPSRVARTRQTRRHSPSRVARTRQTRERRVWQVLCEFSESGESGEFGECRLDRFIHIKYIIERQLTVEAACQQKDHCETKKSFSVIFNSLLQC